MTERDLARRFQAYNARYFGGRLPTYRLQVRAHLPGGVQGRCDEVRRRIYIVEALTGRDEECLSMLLHEMAHAAAGPFHGKRFQREMQRLRDAGAPVAQAEFEPRSGPDRLTRKYVESCASDFLTDCRLSRQSGTFRRFARIFAHQNGLTASALLQRYPWIRAAFQRAREEEREDERLRRKLAEARKGEGR